MAYQIEYFNDSFPYGFTLKCFFYCHTLNVTRLHAMQFTDYILQFLDIAHTAVSTRSPTVRKSRSIPAAIAGVQRKEPCRFTRL